MADESEPALDLCTFRIEKHLVPEWSNYVEKICLHHGENVGVDLEEDILVIRAEVEAENKPGLMRDIERFWDQFVAQRKAMGQWSE